MINILIPMAGRGSRFSEMGYIMPKQLIMVDDTQMIDWSLKSILNKSECNLIFCVRQEHINNFSIDVILKNRYGNDIKIVPVDKITDGSISTCLLAKDYINNEDPLVVYTLDVFFEPKFNPMDLLSMSSEGHLLTFKSNNPSYSYVQLNDDLKVIRAAEKEVISEHAAVGIYCYKRGTDFIKYAEKMINNDVRVRGEFYVCPLFNLMLEDGLTVTTQSVEKMHLMGTPSELEFFVNHTLKKFGDKPIALCCDHSGFDLKEKCKNILTSMNINYIDFGTFVKKDCDYNDYIQQAIEFVDKGNCDFVLSFCRTGQGVNMAGNKFKGIRAALIFDIYTAEYSVRHNCANYFSIPTKYVDGTLLHEMIDVLKNTTFDGGRHMTRVQKMEHNS